VEGASEFSPTQAQLPVGGRLSDPLGGLTGILPSASRLAESAASQAAVVPGGKSGTAAPASSALAPVSNLLGGTLLGGLSQLTKANALPGTTSSAADAANTTTETANGTTQGVDRLSMGETVRGLTAAAKRALPGSSRGELAPLIGHLAPAEMTPIFEAVPGTTQAASIDEIAPLVEDTSGVVSTNGTKAAGSYSDAMTSLTWTTDALTGDVSGYFTRN
jgi:hypothetical protein